MSELRDVYKKRMIENTEFVALEDGFVYAWTNLLNGRSGAITANELRIVADELDRRNAAWEKEICSAFEKLNENNPEAQMSELREKLAELEHNQWSHWTLYMLDNLTPENIKRWKRQIDTPYAQLDKLEKESDRAWADRVLSLLPSPAMSGVVNIRSCHCKINYHGHTVVDPACPDCHGMGEITRELTQAEASEVLKEYIALIPTLDADTRIIRICLKSGETLRLKKEEE